MVQEHGYIPEVRAGNRHRELSGVITDDGLTVWSTGAVPAMMMVNASGIMPFA